MNIFKLKYKQDQLTRNKLKISFVMNENQTPMSSPKMLWSPCDKLKNESNMNNFMVWVNESLDYNFKNYQDLWNWSVNEDEQFWESILQFYKIEYSGSYSKVKSQASQMHETRWFEGMQLNYAEHIFRNYSDDFQAITFKKESDELINISWNELKHKTSKVAKYLKSNNIQKGDRVCSMLPNCPEAVIAFLAVNSIGAIWSSCSPDFGTKSIIDRFQQIKPKAFIATNGYQYNGRTFNKTEEINKITETILSIESTLVLEYISEIEPPYKTDIWSDIMKQPEQKLTFTRVDFSDPIWILYSSGTTGKPKAITHSVGGITIEHFKALSLHQNVKPGDKFFWYSTTGWMMWNYATSALLAGGTIAMYDGSPAFPKADILWEFAEEAEITHFGAGASYYIYCMKEGMNFTNSKAIQNIQSFGSTGSPLPPETFDWFYKSVNKNAWVISLSGGTDICSGFVGGNPFESVYEGEIQCRMLGVNLQAYSEEGISVENKLGEMIIENALPSMPIYFWNDQGNKRYKSSYFEMYLGKWRHGDWIKITNRKTVIIYGRSDATLNRSGVRIGTSEVYSATESVKEVKDSLVVCIDHSDGTQSMPMFIKLHADIQLDMKLKRDIKKAIKTQFSPRHIPDQIIQVTDIPYTMSGKKMEAPVKKILSGIPIEEAVSKDAMKNPEALDFFINFNLK